MIFLRTIIFFFIFFLSTNSFSFEKLKFNKPKFSGFKSNTAILPSKEITKPVPAVILLPVCSGVNSKTIGDYKRWSKFFIENGYATLTVDFYKGRNAQSSGCTVNRKVGEVQITKDLYDAVEYLSQIENIDKNRIFSLGFSLGSLANGLIASEKMSKRIGKDRPRPRAVGSLYGGCVFGWGFARFLYPDSNLPIIWLMGSKDNEVPPSLCLDTLKEIKKINKTKVEWHVYDGATHCWDCRSLSGTTRVADWNKETVTYIYKTEFVKDSEQRVLKFFNSFK